MASNEEADGCDVSTYILSLSLSGKSPLTLQNGKAEAVFGFRLAKTLREVCDGSGMTSLVR